MRSRATRPARCSAAPSAARRSWAAARARQGSPRDRRPVGMWVFPLAAALTALAFAGLVTKEFVQRRRPYLLAWAIALFMFAAASAAAFLGILSGWNTRLFAIYWLFGAVLNVPFLAAGEVLLLFRSKAVEVGVLLVMIFITAFAFNAVRGADMRGVALECRDLPLGKAVFSSRPTNIEHEQGFIFDQE